MLYTTYRPQTFSEVAGQEENMVTLRSLAISGKYASANLFAGHRGTGKTTIARILARVICCENPTDDGPCNNCRNCQSILNNKTYDYIELDAASHNTIGDIKDLVSSTAYLPTTLPKKIYIIDEVHNLSSSAFDALLKTIEEPPAHCVFILCTTELHKIPSTIKSRCSIYQFNALSLDVICEQLMFVLNDLKKDYEEGAISVIAKQADGSLRDALSILEKLIISSDVLTMEHVKRMLCLMDDDITLSILSHIFTENGKDTIRILQGLHEEGKSLQLLVDNILQSLTDAIILMSSSNTAKIYNSKEYINQLNNMVSLTDLELLFWLTEQFSILREKIRNSLNPYMDVQLQLIKCCNPDLLNDSRRAVIKRLESAEAEIISLQQKLDSYKPGIVNENKGLENSIPKDIHEKTDIVLPKSIMDQDESDSEQWGIEDSDALFTNNVTLGDESSNSVTLESSKLEDTVEREEDSQKDDGILDLFSDYL